MGKRNKHAAPQAHGTKSVNPVKPELHRVCFKAVDDRDKPLAGIEVKIQQKGKARSGKTGLQGRLLFSKLPAGQVQVLAIRGDRMYEFAKYTVGDILPGVDQAGPGEPEMKVVIPRDQAKKYSVKKDDTLAGIVNKPDSGVADWKDLALYNWGTDVTDEVNRALMECVGCSELDKDPSKTVLDPPKGETRQILIPKPCTSAELGKDLALDKMYVFTLKPIRPANAISIPTLDKWFIPGVEDCDVKYQLEGLNECASVVEFQVYGSKYCKCTDWNKGMGKYTALPDTPVFEKIAGNSAKERKLGAILIADPKSKKKGKWKGQASAGEGILGVKAKDKERYLNVAFSPYSVLLRYYLGGGDKTAALIALPFWPLWEETKTDCVANAVEAPDKVTIAWNNAAPADRGSLAVLDKDDQVVYAAALTGGKLAAGAQTVEWDKKYRGDAWNSRMLQEFLAADGAYKYKVSTAVLKPKADSLKAEWLVKNTGRLERGLLVIVDGGDKVVFRAPLPKDQLAKSADDNDKRSYTWDGKYWKGIKNSKNGDSIIPEDMPYRIEIQGHTGINEPKGLALAAKHTEVRLAVAPRTLDSTDPAYSRVTDAASIDLSLGPIYAGPLPKDETAALWAQIKLAEAGYYPGPVLGKNHPQYALALREFQRTIPVAVVDPKKSYDRLAVNGAADDKTRGAIKTLAGENRRPKFANPASPDLDSYPDKSANEWKALGEIVGDRTKGLIVWVDARHYYTTSPTEQALVTIDNYHGAFEIGDGLEARDRAATCRPWIPLAASFRLLSKTKSLFDPLDDAPTDPKTIAMQRSAIGPLRVDWTFDEMGPDLSRVNTAAYEKTRTRTLRYLQWALKTTSALHDRKELKRKALYTNCPEGNGGIRSAAADYYKAALGYGDDESLWPWQGVPDATVEGIATVVHDHLVSTQPKETEPLYDDWRGRAGVYFRPSIVAGDGYRVRAQVRFAAAGTDYQFPNLDALAKRYPKLPQAHTAAFRVWRRSSVRAYLRWSPIDNAGHLAGVNDCYHAAHVHFIAEAKANEHEFQTHRPLDLIDTPAQITDFKKVITDRVTADYHKNNPDKITFVNDYTYPWRDEIDLGWPWPSAPGDALQKATDLIAEVENATWERFQEALLFGMIRRIEERYGRMRGHVLAHFKGGPPFWVRRYACDKVGGCGQRYWYLEKTELGKNQDGQDCPGPGPCGGKLRLGQCEGTYECTAGCGFTPETWGPDTWPGGGLWNGAQCPGCHAMTLQMTGVPTVTVAESVEPAPRTIVYSGVGYAGGGAWLYAEMKAWEWAHEMGHHRHLEHAADAPVGPRTAERDKLHDSETNTLPGAAFVGGTAALNQRWDRCCIMSYVDCSPQYDLALDKTYFCGKCVLRNAGWKVQDIEDSASKIGPGGGKNDD